MIGAFAALWIMGEPFGFMAFLGVASLVGVIVSHSIVLFDFIEERHIVGDDLELALIDAGILRLRPVLIKVFATVSALVPLAAHGGPLWKPLCLCANWRLAGRDSSHEAPSPSDVRYFCSRPQNSKMGCGHNERPKCLASAPLLPEEHRLAAGIIIFACEQRRKCRDVCLRRCQA